MMDRRAFVTVVGATILAAPLATEGQQAAKVYRIGIMFETAHSSTGENQWREAFRRRGYVLGRNAVFEFRWAGDRFEDLPSLAADLIRLKVDVIVTASTAVAIAARHATTTVPIITQSGDPIGAGLVAGVARPGGNVTGIILPLADMGAKRLQLLRETVPNLDSLAIVWNPLNEAARIQLKAMEAAAKTMVVATHAIEMRRQTDLDQVFSTIIAKRVRGLIVVQDEETLRAARQIATFCARHRLPGSYPYRPFVDAGGLMSYGPNIEGLREATVAYADKVLRGALPADLPMEQPMRYELVINLKAAQALGLTMPRTLLLQADHVIE